MACGLIYLIALAPSATKIAHPWYTTICETGSLINLKRLFKIEQASVKLIEVIPGFSGRNFKLDCLSTVFTDKYTDTTAFLPLFQLYIDCLKAASTKLFNVELKTQSLYLYATTKRLHNTQQHIHFDVNFPENFNAQGQSHRG